MIGPATDAVALCEELVSFDTVSARPNEALIGRLQELLEARGARVRRVVKPGEPGQVNLVGRMGPEGEGGLALAGHTDTVPFETGMRATNAPERDGRRLYGRGTCDMKGAIGAMVLAAGAVPRERLRRPLWFAFTFQEEIGCHGAKLLAAAAPVPAERCIIGEPTGLRPVSLHKGYTIGEAVLRGSPCHSSDPGAGASALHAAARAIDRVLALGARWQARGDPESPLRPPYTTINVGLASGGSARNVVPEHARFTIEARPMPGEEPAALLDEVEAALREAAATVPGVAAELRRVELDRPFEAAADGDLVPWLEGRTGRAAGSVPFYTEAPFFRRMGADVCVCGPGEIAQAHRVDEWVAFDALEEAVDLYREAIQEFCT